MAWLLLVRVTAPGPESCSPWAARHSAGESDTGGGGPGALCDAVGVLVARDHSSVKGGRSLCEAPFSLCTLLPSPLPCPPDS